MLSVCVWMLQALVKQLRHSTGPIHAGHMNFVFPCWQFIGDSPSIRAGYELQCAGVILGLDGKNILHLDVRTC